MGGRRLFRSLGVTGGEWSGTGTAMGGRRLFRCRRLLAQNGYHIVCGCFSRLFCWNGYELVGRNCCLLFVLAVAAAARARCCGLRSCCSFSLVLPLPVLVVAGGFASHRKYEMASDSTTGPEENGIGR